MADFYQFSGQISWALQDRFRPKTLNLAILRSYSVRSIGVCFQIKTESLQQDIPVDFFSTFQFDQ